MKIRIILYNYLVSLNEILLSKCILLEIKYKKLNAMVSSGRIKVDIGVKTPMFHITL